MRIPRTEEISILFMSELVPSYPNKLITLSSVAQKHGISVLFLKKLARQLKHAGLVQSKEGTGGGYKLGLKPDQISLWDIMQAVDVRTSENPQDKGECPLNTRCIPQRIYQSMNEAMQEKFSRITLIAVVT